MGRALTSAARVLKERAMLPNFARRKAIATSIRKTIAPIMAVGLGCAVNVAAAYDNYYNSPLFYTHMSNNVLQMHAIDMERQSDRIKKLQGNQARSQPRPRQIAPPARDLLALQKSAMAYQRDMALSARIREDFVNGLVSIATPSEVEGVRQLMREKDMVDFYALLMRNAQLDSTRMEDILAYWYVQMWLVTNKISAKPSPAQYQAVAAQIDSSISSSEHWKSMSDRQKQTLVEGLIFPAIIQHSRYLGYTKARNTRGLDQLASAARAGLQKSQLAIHDMRLTDQGFVR
jgi:hypothetical protein